MDGRNVLRVLCGEGVRVTKRDDSLALTPPERVTPELVDLAKRSKESIAALVAELPAWGRCPICGDSTGWPEKDQLHCVGCALVAAERVRDEREAA